MSETNVAISDGYHMILQQCMLVDFGSVLSVNRVEQSRKTCRAKLNCCGLYGLLQRLEEGLLVITDRLIDLPDK